MTNEELTAIYNEANGLDPKRHNPITTERIFAAMRAATEIEREACKSACNAVAAKYSKKAYSGGTLMDRPADCMAQALAASQCGSAIAMRSNAPYAAPVRCNLD